MLTHFPALRKSCCPVVQLLKTYDCFGCAVNCNKFLFHILLFTSLHVSASTGHPQAKIYSYFLKAIMPTMNPFLDYTVHYFKLCYVIQLKFDIKFADNVFKIAILYKKLSY
jgi:hypothetical protein